MDFIIFLNTYIFGPLIHGSFAGSSFAKAAAGLI